MKRYFPHIAALLFALILVVPMWGRRVRVKVDDASLQRGLRQEASQDSIANACLDTLLGAEALAAVRLYGYDKPHSAGQESFFIKSELDADTVKGVCVDIEYLSVDGVQLHTRRIPLQCAIPPGTSRRVMVGTWDKTHTFYYYRTPPARVRNLTPYMVRVIPHRVIVSPSARPLCECGPAIDNK